MADEMRDVPCRTTTEAAMSSAGRSPCSRAGATMIAAVCLAMTVLCVPRIASADGLDRALAQGWSGASCASATSLSQLVHSSLAENPDVPSVQVAVYSPRCGLFRDVAGVQDIASNTPATHSTRYGVASVSKMITASAVWTLIQRHQIGLHDTIDRWFSPDELFGVHEVTVNDLLIGTTPYQSYDNTPQWLLQYPDPTQQLSEQQILKFINDYGPVSLAEKLLDPLNGDSYILSVLLERVRHRPFAEVMSALIFNRIGMHDSDILEGVAPADGRHATPYSGSTPAYFNQSQAPGSAAVATTATDLVRFTYRNFVREKILDDDTLQTIFGPGPLTATYLAQPTFGLFDANRFTNPSVTGIAFLIPNLGPGFFIVSDFNGNGQLVIGGVGNALGQSGLVVWDPATDAVIAVLSNSDGALFYDLALMHLMLANAMTP
jgi:CubicO group peptidase (beta-lactamase class C family)